MATKKKTIGTPKTTISKPLPGLEDAVVSMKDFERDNVIIPAYVPDRPLATNDYGFLWDFMGPFAICLGLLTLGYAMGLMR